MLRRDFEGLRRRVIAAVRARLNSAGVTIDEADLDGCYATAWQGLYAATLDGEEIESTQAWLIVVTHRRALEEHRARMRHERRVIPRAGVTDDPHEALADRQRLAQLMEGMRGRLDARECEAAMLCYLQGYSRAEAARCMGISETRMRKLMEGRGRGEVGVAGKVGALVRSITEGDYCDQQASLMRALAFGVLDPAGERHSLAMHHQRQCPRCRHYVTSLRGLAVALPPMLISGRTLALLAAATRDAKQAHGGAWRSAHGTAARVGAGTSGAAAGGSAAGGGWLVGTGPLGAKLAVGCLLALGVGAGCADLVEQPHRPVHRRARVARRLIVPTGEPRGADAAALAAAQSPTTAESKPHVGEAIAPAARASREFGLEQAATLTSRKTAAAPVAQTAVRHDFQAPSAVSSGSAAARTEQGAAEREFSPG
jgi:DNA-directed RNA polymerase specialized sigma24 family protein